MGFLFCTRHFHVSPERIVIKPISVDKNLPQLSVEPGHNLAPSKDKLLHFFNCLHDPLELCKLN